MFENVREDVNANRPDRFIGSGVSRRSQTMTGLALPVSSSNPLYRTDTAGRIDAGLSDGLFQMKEKVVKDAEGYGSAATSEVNHMRSALTDDLGQLKGRLRQKMSEIEGLEKDIESHGQRVFESKEAELSKGAQDKIKEMGKDLWGILSSETFAKYAKQFPGDHEKEIESYGRQTIEKKEHEAEMKATDATVDAAGRIQATLEFKDPFRGEKRDF